MSPALGATYLGRGRCEFLLWAPQWEQVEVRIVGPCEQLVPMQPQPRGYHHGVADGVEPGSLYLYRLGRQEEGPDPASRFQPQGVHGPSQVVNPAFDWHDLEWSGLPLEHYILYEIHVGAFTAEGTFDAILPCLHELKQLGVTALELMPVAQFSGERNWGYDGVFPFAVQNSYGGPGGLKRLVNACHQEGLAVVLDVVYNHLGPEGNFLANFGPYFTDRYRTPWGQAVNFDGTRSDEVRRLFIEDALYWTGEFHVDALRLDAIHAIVDPSAQSFLEELGVAVHEQAERLERRVYVIAESDRNDARCLRPRQVGGCDLDAQWNDDFHHALHTLLTGEREGYYADFGHIENLARAFTEGYVYSGQYSAYRQRRHGNSSRDIPAHRFVVCAQNHDQVGNRLLGERLSQLTCFEGLKLAAAVVLLSPFIPLLFMGEEYGETAPFPYFVSHSDPALIQAVPKGRREGFAAFQWQGEMPDPQDERTFLHAKLHRDLRQQGTHRILYDFYQELIRLRKHTPALACLNKEALAVSGNEKEKTLFVRRWKDSSQVFTVFHFGDGAAELRLPIPPGHWQKLLDSRDPRWAGDGSSAPEKFAASGETRFTVGPKSVVLFETV